MVRPSYLNLSLVSVLSLYLFCEHTTESRGKKNPNVWSTIPLTWYDPPILLFIYTNEEKYNGRVISGYSHTEEEIQRQYWGYDKKCLEGTWDKKGLETLLYMMSLWAFFFCWSLCLSSTGRIKWMFCMCIGMLMCVKPSSADVDVVLCSTGRTGFCAGWIKFWDFDFKFLFFSAIMFSHLIRSNEKNWPPLAVHALYNTRFRVVIALLYQEHCVSLRTAL